MGDLERMLIESPCERLVTQYCHFVDHGEAERVAELFETMACGPRQRTR